jgi:hypothetical protein
MYVHYDLIMPSLPTLHFSSGACNMQISVRYTPVRPLHLNIFSLGTCTCSSGVIICSHLWTLCMIQKWAFLSTRTKHTGCYLKQYSTDYGIYLIYAAAWYCKSPRSGECDPLTKAAGYTHRVVGGSSAILWLRAGPFSFSSASLARCCSEAWNLRDLFNVTVAGINFVRHEFLVMMIKDELQN